MGEIRNNQTPSQKIDDIEKQEGRGCKFKVPVKTWRWDWDIALLNWLKRIFKKGETR